jgi:hypothetical protein
MATLLPRAAFVGRDAELEGLRGAFDAAAVGQGGLVMLVGEPGIGKTALADQLVSYVIAQGGRTLVGHCYEQGSLSLPYLPFIEALRSYVIDRDELQLRAEAGSGVLYLAGIIPELGDRLDVQPPPPGEPEQDRLRLVAAVCDLLRRVSALQPILLVLEDLHDADRGTLDLLLFVTRNLQNSRVLLVGTYRDVDVDRVHPLSGTLAELRRVSRFHRVLLRGLPVHDVAHLLREMRMPEPGWSLAEPIHEQTEGNPLFVRELVYDLASEFSATGRIASLTNLPEGLRDVIGRRLSRLSREANQALAAAAVIGREFRLDVLRTLLDAPDDSVESALAEAVGAGIIQEQATLGATVIYRFSHALFRQALYEELIAPRRIRLHQQVARALQNVYGNDPRVHAAELAEHYAFSENPAELALAVAYCEVAAQQAMRVYAYSEAERLLQRALEVQQLLDPSDATRRCDLLLQLGAAALPAGVPERVISTVVEVFAIAESIPDGLRAAKAAELALEALFVASTGPGSNSTPEVYAWLERLERHAATDSAERALAHCWRGLSAISTGQVAVGCAQLRIALERASHVGDENTFRIVSSFCITLLAGVRDRDLVEQLAFDAYQSGRPLPRFSTPNVQLFDLGRLLLECGDRAAAEQVWRDQSQLVELTADATLKGPSLLADSRLAFLDGRLEDAAVIAKP